MTAATAEQIQQAKAELKANIISWVESGVEAKWGNKTGVKTLKLDAVKATIAAMRRCHTEEDIAFESGNFSPAQRQQFAEFARQYGELVMAEIDLEIAAKQAESEAYTEPYADDCDYSDSKEGREAMERYNAYNRRRYPKPAKPAPRRAPIGGGLHHSEYVSGLGL
jgi:hypothetical protein